MDKQKAKESLLIEYIKTSQESLYRLAYSYVKNEDNALDLVQNAIVKALTKLHSLKHTEYMKTWLYRILVNECLMFIRKNKNVAFSLLDDDNLQTTNTISNSEGSLELNDAIDHIHPKLKTVIVLRYFEDLKLSEIAEVTNTNLSTVKSRLYKAHQELKDLLNEN